MDVLIAIMTGVLAGAAPPADSAPADAPAPAPGFLTVTDQQLDQMVAELGHPRFTVRQNATRRLCTLDTRYLPELARRYRLESNCEMKHRIRYVVESIFYRNQIAGREGFLGIRISRQVDPSIIDPVTGRKTRGVVVVQALKDLPADHAGLRAGDVIISTDGRPLPDGPSSQGFTDMISARPPGSVVRIRVLCAAEMPREVTLTAGGEAMKTIAGVELTAPPPGIALGPRIVSILPGGPAAAAGLRVNEIIDSVNGVRLTGHHGLATLESTLEASKPGDVLTLGVRSVQTITLAVTLGARPVKYLKAPDKAKARARFVRWWQDQGGELSIRPPKPPTATAPTQPIEFTPPVPENAVIP